MCKVCKAAKTNSKHTHSLPVLGRGGTHFLMHSHRPREAPAVTQACPALGGGRGGGGGGERGPRMTGGRRGSPTRDPGGRTPPPADTDANRKRHCPRRRAGRPGQASQAPSLSLSVPTGGGAGPPLPAPPRSAMEGAGETTLWRPHTFHVQFQGRATPAPHPIPGR